ncbi:TetR/AcrR family transcriptional regulator [Schumannella soli]|uniref:TetR/AcrR family transcriptional regulator n=1 Tax=Schumannella soli TaxID=2590779 RepID=UPI002102867F|nr:TetR/AcrR family transcriptional regulator [Schumannella soli]
MLDVASAAFAADPETSLNAIAKSAGVGAGTLYRHFPTREDLLLAVYKDEIEGLEASVSRTLEQQEPLDAFRVWARHLAASVRVKHGLGEALSTPTAQALTDSTYGPVTSAIGQLLDAAAERGAARPGIDPSDVLLMLSALWRVPPTDSGLAQADRVLELIIDSVRTEPGA